MATGDKQPRKTPNEEAKEVEKNEIIKSIRANQCLVLLAHSMDVDVLVDNR